MEIFLGVLFVLICLLLIVVVLLQKGRGGGLGAAFGGMGSSAFGTKVGDVFTWVTIVLTALFLISAIVTTMYYRPAQATQISAPKFAPEAGIYTQTQIVEISSQTPDSKIYYTTDGSDPSEKSTAYQKAIRVDPGTTLRAVAYRSGKHSSVSEGYFGPKKPAVAATRPVSLAPMAPATPATSPATMPAER